MNITPFETAKHVSEFWREYRTAREFCSILEYNEYKNFMKVVKKAKDACLNSGFEIKNHFKTFTDMVPHGENKLKKRENIKLSRYACYLIVQNANPDKRIVAQWQSYFAEQTRKQELMQNPQLREDMLRVETRKELLDHQKELFSVAKKAWVSDYWSFQNAWYTGLYGWLNKHNLIKKKWLKKNDNMYNYMGSEELGANLFRTTQTEAKLRRAVNDWQNLWQDRSDSIHFKVWEKVRQTIHEIWWTMPENLPITDHIKEAKERLEMLGVKSVLEHASQPPENITYHFEVPQSVQKIEKLQEIIKNNPGAKEIIIGSVCYHCSEDWLEEIRRIYPPKNQPPL